MHSVTSETATNMSFQGAPPKLARSAPDSSLGNDIFANLIGNNAAADANNALPLPQPPPQSQSAPPPRRSDNNSRAANNNDNNQPSNAPPTTIRTTIRVRRPHPLPTPTARPTTTRRSVPGQNPLRRKPTARPRPRAPARPPIRTRRLPVRRHRTAPPLWCRPRRGGDSRHRGDNSDVHRPCHPTTGIRAACDCRRRAGGQPVGGSAGCGTASCGSAGAGHDRRRRNGCNDRLNATRATRRCIDDEVHRNRHACESAGNPDRHRRDRRRNGGCRGRQHNTCHKSAGRQDRSTNRQQDVRRFGRLNPGQPAHNRYATAHPRRKTDQRGQHRRRGEYRRLCRLAGNTGGNRADA